MLKSLSMGFKVQNDVWLTPHIGILVDEGGSYLFDLELVQTFALEKPLIDPALDLDNKRSLTTGPPAMCWAAPEQGEISQYFFTIW